MFLPLAHRKGGHTKSAIASIADLKDTKDAGTFEPLRGGWHPDERHPKHMRVD